MSSSISKIERGASLAVLVMALGLGAGAVSADEATGFYVGALGGANFTETASVKFNAAGVSNLPADVSHKTGWGAGVLAGYDFGPFRLQGDVVFRRNKLDTLDNVPGFDGKVDLDGRSSSVAPMLSALYDISTGSSLTPYIGAGVGAARNTLKSDGISSSKWSVAYQGIAGVNYDLATNVGLVAEYRYFATPERSVGSNISEYKYDNHSIFLGVTYRFGTAPAAPVAPAVAVPPPPPPPAAPELARSYLVFFDWNASAITAEAAAIINEAAAAAKKLAVTRIDLTGHADRSGAPAYNQKLSEKRGAAVKNALVQLGIPADQISVVAKGETSPLVPTADGVREPQNRRVEIVLP